MRRAGLFVLFFFLPSRGFALDLQLEGHGLLQVWATLYEQMEEAEGLRQHPSGDAAATWTSGFSVNRARVGLDVKMQVKRAVREANVVKRLDPRAPSVSTSTSTIDVTPFGFRESNEGLALHSRGDLQLRVVGQLRLAKQPALLDCYLAVDVAEWLSISLGQMKIPGPRQSLDPAQDLDFIFRPIIAEVIPDYSLSRTTYASSLFYGVRSYRRDLGLRLSGDVPFGYGSLRYQLMMGNGLGSNLFISGAQREFILTNTGQFYWGGRVELANIVEIVTLGGHLSYNRHDDMSFQSGRVVIDLKRQSYSSDVEIRIPYTGAKLRALYGEGEVDDDFDNDGRVDLHYSGWTVGATWSLHEPLASQLERWGLPGHRLTLGARYDTFRSEWNGSGVEVEEHRWTFGLTYGYPEWFQLQLNYVTKEVIDPSVPDLDDNILLLAAQAAI